MNILKRLWQWYTDRRIKRRMLKGPSVYGAQTTQSHLPANPAMTALPVPPNH